MSKNLLNLCKKIGLFKLEEKKIFYGPYGQSILLEIKNLWLKSILNKNENVNLIDDLNSLDIDYYIESLLTNRFSNKSGFSLISLNNEKINGINEENMIIKSNYKHNLNFYNFTMDNDKHNDRLLNWIQKRKAFWVRLFSMPENIEMKILSDDNVKFVYNYNGVEKSLERISCFNYEKFNKESLLPKMSLKFEKLTFIQTNSELIFENLLVDSIRERILSKRPVFHLDLRISPYKACILMKSNSIESQQISDDLLNLFLKSDIKVFKQEFSEDNELNGLFEKFDEFGIPFVIILPDNLNQNGICYLRSRDTTIQEHLHFTHLVDQFKFLLNSIDQD